MNMDRAYIEANSVAQRYLSGKLSDDESRAFEAACAKDPALLDDFSLDYQLKAGMERLAGRGEIRLARHGTPSALRRPPRYLLAASVVVALVGIGTSSWLALRTSRQQRTIADLQRQLSAPQAPQVLVSTQRILRVRSDRIEVRLPSTGWLGLSLDASGLEGEAVDVELKRESGESILRQPFVVPADGAVFLVADATTLARGDYSVTVAPRTGNASSVITYRLRLSGDRPR